MHILHAVGVGISRITANFHQIESKLDGSFQANDTEVVEMAYHVMRNDGLFIGPSAALNLVGAVKVARELGPGKTVVTILCDGGERYASKLYNNEWLEQRKLTPKHTERNLDFVK